MTLHTLNQSPHQSSLPAECLSLTGAGDHLVLLENGVYAGLTQSPVTSLLQQQMDSGLSVYAIALDAEARGITQKLQPGITLIDYPTFVALCVDHHPIKNWF